ncbi:hypothetical protein NQ314_013621 [Rhamnusium bicolor]|uniref:Regulatory protein zeste n=1 Tax=Rhamnusium bicolor TaxID=1586634 RepID=A0AAV8X543_9CUCU|nr:hypothetical protein NQ314_013621 [Rhamnusium bicolor]
MEASLMAFKMNENHWNVLIDFMESHKEFARGQFVGPSGKTTQRKLWEELSGKLNSLGHGISKASGKMAKGKIYKCQICYL